MKNPFCNEVDYEEKSVTVGDEVRPIHTGRLRKSLKERLAREDQPKSTTTATTLPPQPPPPPSAPTPSTTAESSVPRKQSVKKGPAVPDWDQTMREWTAEFADRIERDAQRRRRAAAAAAEREAAAGAAAAAAEAAQVE
ncbi:hypothetical protein BDZ88DRAFT_453258 [Geranomyces variabilis]|nr:hypothetical protein BDZ88DRAFT_453258 [Geranomyces variabilis]KAJ3133626.1 hypothetical protein HDU90_005704 [Geranomyces variabilis]